MGETGIGARGRSRTGTAARPRDFKSLVSTNFTTRAEGGLRKSLPNQVLIAQGCTAKFDFVSKPNNP